MHFVASLLRLALLQCKIHNTMRSISSIFLTRAPFSFRNISPAVERVPLGAARASFPPLLEKLLLLFHLVRSSFGTGSLCW
uniref:Uncharacterized protein n=1 Tax=Arundo donax TaxID=35708 RepID=A0A0A9C1Y7_ARUDO